MRKLVPHKQRFSPPRKFRRVVGRVIGGGGGGGGKAGDSGGGSSGGTPTEDPDTLISRAYARLIDVVSEGQIEGFVHPEFPLEDIYLDGTPVQSNNRWASFNTGITATGSKTFKVSEAAFNPGMVGRYINVQNFPANTLVNKYVSPTEITLSKAASASGSGKTWQLGGTLNFSSFAWWFMPGSQTQTYIPGFNAAESTVGVGVRVKFGLPWEHTFSDLTIDAVRVDLKLPRLQEQDQSTGNITGTTVRIQIFRKLGSGGFTLMVDDTITDKASSTYIRTYQIDMAGTVGPWTIQVVRVTPDSDSEFLQNETWVETYTEVVYGKLRYPNTAYLAVQMDAQNFATIPTRAYRLKGLRVKIPSNYDPIARTYDETPPWDGSFVVAWTNNPAWCWYDMATNARYGLGNLIDPDSVDKFALYTIGKYCDEMVNDGFGGTEPRFTCNLVLQRREDATKVLQDMAGIFRGMIAYINGSLTPVQDAPTDPSAYRLFTPANVINGVFNYSGTSLRARHNSVLVSWNDLNDAGRIKQEFVDDHDAVLKAGGLNQLEIVGFGCTSRGQARRMALWALYAEKLLTDTVGYSTGVEGYFIKPGQIIQIQDPFRAGQVLSGRLLAATTTVLTLDRPVTLESGKVYTVAVYNPQNGLIVAKTVSTGAGTVSSLTVGSAFGFTPDAESIWQLSTPTLVPALYRVLGVTAKENKELEVTALQYNASLYDFVDFDHDLSEPPTDRLPGGEAVEPPGAVLIEEIITITPLEGAVRSLELSWTQSPDRFVTKYRVGYRLNGGNWVGLDGQLDTASTSFVLNNAQVGFYEFKIFAINTLGVLSVAVPVDYEITAANPLGDPTVTGLELFGQANDTEFRQRDAKFAWRINAPSSFYEFGSGSMQDGTQHPTFAAFDIKIFNGEDEIWREQTNTSEYTFTLEKNQEAMSAFYGEGTPALNEFRIEVRILDSYNNLSDPARLTVSNPPPPPVTDATVFGSPNGVSLQWTPPNVVDIDHYEFFMGTDIDDPDPVYMGMSSAPSTSAIVNYSLEGVRAWWVAVVDTFGNHSEMVFAGEVLPGFQIAPPVISPPGGFFAGSIDVSITCETQSTSIFYTLAAGGVGGWTRYTGPITLTDDAELHAYAGDNNDPYHTSEVVAVTFTEDSSVCATPTFAPPPGSYWSNNVVITTPTTGAQLIYTTDGTAPVWPSNGTIIPANHGTVSVPNGTSTLKALAHRAGLTDSAVQSGVYNIGGGGGTVATPTFSPVAGAYLESSYPKLITISTTTTGASIRWTTDGTVPSPTFGTVYTGPVSVAAGKTLKAIAYKSGLTPSAVASGLYSVANPCATPLFNPAAGSYPTFPKDITITCATPGATMRWTTDGSSPSQTHGTVYSGPVSVAIGQTLKAIAYKTGLADSAIASGLYTGKTATPDIEPPSGLYSGGFNVTITCATPGSTIKYTKDGSTPTPAHGTTYSAPFAVLPYVVVKAIAFGAAGYSNSNVATNVYDLQD